MAFLNSVIAEFRDQLNAITVQVRDIEPLSLVAKDMVHFAPDIAAAVEQHIFAVRDLPAQRLACLYLIDNICKRVGQPYNELFSKNLPALFQQAYRTLPGLRHKMRSLLDVWGRMQLFPAGVLQHTTALADAEDAADAAAGAQTAWVAPGPPSFPLPPPPPRDA